MALLRVVGTPFFLCSLFKFGYDVLSLMNPVILECELDTNY